MKVQWPNASLGVTLTPLFRPSITSLENCPVTLARHGVVLAQTYRFIFAQDSRDGRLKEVLRDSAGASRPFSILYPANRHMPHRVRALIKFLVEEFGR